MAEFRDYSLTLPSPASVLVAMASLASLSCSPPSRAEPLPGAAPVVVTNLASPGAFSVRNASPQEVRVAREVIVERQTAGKWEQIVAPVELVQRCENPPAGSCIALAGSATIRPVPWNGYSCAPQCPGSCRANVYAGPGTFRFVVTSCDRTQRFTGPAFELPAERK